VRYIIKVTAIVFASALAAFLVSTPLLVDAQDSPPAEGEVVPEHEYVGVSTCARRCHSRDQIGDQLGIWTDGPHAQAYETLGTAEAAELAAAAGIEGNPQEAAECLRCHTTAWGVSDSYLSDRFDRTRGVQCESCHGPGDDYKPRGVHSEDPEAGAAAGLTSSPGEEVCTRCHNSESPTFAGFDYDERVLEIVHSIPGDEPEEATEEPTEGPSEEPTEVAPEEAPVHESVEEPTDEPTETEEPSEAPVAAPEENTDEQ